ncbi:hypothetical protein CB1_001951008 [Camelus ferus]|nr:hypothetical protein CB1_001951008 [Camelus ferus]
MRKPDGKIVLLGDMNVGKTSLLQRYMERRFTDTVSTVGGAFYLKQWRSYNISIWDTAGPRLGDQAPSHSVRSPLAPLCSHLTPLLVGKLFGHSVPLSDHPALRLRVTPEGLACRRECAGVKDERVARSVALFAGAGAPSHRLPGVLLKVAASPQPPQDPAPRSFRLDDGAC